MARRRLTPAQPGYLAPAQSRPAPAPAATPRAVAPIAQVSGQSAEAAALREITESLQAARDEGRMIVEVPLADIAQGHLVRDRISLDAEEIAALKASIAAHGQRTPAEITPLPEPAAGEATPPYRFGLISGWRRLRALSELYEDTGEERFSTLRALIRPPEEAADSYVAMVEENEIRVGLSYYERARVVAEAAARGVFADQSAALRSLFATASRAKRSKIGSFIDIHEALGDLLNYPAEIPERLGLALVSRLRLGDRNAIRAALTRARPANAAAELALLEKLAQPPKTDVSRAKHSGEVLRDGLRFASARKGQKITLTLSGPGVDDALLDRLRQAIRAAEGGQG
ncbi:MULTISPECIES: ParB N-terminal domain-containing protein [unclassified Meridianimarinicoccus]|uniref:ParB N-terminal domain-containing protein n=1 Tax=unclassified Meridianimarinicoccus TaxID=2923344 RepID=UPI001867E232|nr:ParB N-terminal domain-containing protein [Fluviibacterium sp. MJW13]